MLWPARQQALFLWFGRLTYLRRNAHVRRGFFHLHRSEVLHFTCTYTCSVPRQGLVAPSVRCARERKEGIVEKQTDEQHTNPRSPRGSALIAIWAAKCAHLPLSNKH